VTLIVLLYAAAGYHGVMFEGWYGTPYVPFMCVVLFTGVRGFFPRPTDTGAQALLIILGGIVILGQIAQLQLSASPGGHRFAPIFSDWREDRFAAACQILNNRLSDTSVIAATDIGTIGTYCRGRVLDTAGLVTPGLGHYYPVPRNVMAPGAIYAFPAKLIDDKKPDYIIAARENFEGTLFSDPYFLAHYTLFAQVSDVRNPDTDVLIYMRR